MQIQFDVNIIYFKCVLLYIIIKNFFVIKNFKLEKNKVRVKHKILLCNLVTIRKQFVNHKATERISFSFPRAI